MWSRLSESLQDHVSRGSVFLKHIIEESKPLERYVSSPGGCITAKWWTDPHSAYSCLSLPHLCNKAMSTQAEPWGWRDGWMDGGNKRPNPKSKKGALYKSNREKKTNKIVFILSLWKSSALVLTWHEGVNDCNVWWTVNVKCKMFKGFISIE